jgi:hypothetical protein
MVPHLGGGDISWILGLVVANGLYYSAPARRRRRRVLHRQGGEPAEPVRVFRYDLCQVVIGPPGMRPRCRRILAALQAGNGEGQH